MAPRTLDCRQFALQADDWLDGRLDAAQRAGMQLHAAGCAGCGRAYRRAADLHAALRGFDVPGMRPGFAEHALARATAATGRDERAFGRLRLGVALAAGLALVIGVGAAWRAAPPTIVLTEKQPESVRLVFRAAEPIDGATLSLRLPENVEIVGYGAQRELTWQTDLREGANLLRLPLVARGPVSGEFVARLSSGARSRTFRLRVRVRGAGPAARSPSGSAHWV